jgi:hypothetical protein
MIKPEWYFMNERTNYQIKTQELISTFIREADISEDSAKKMRYNIRKRNV